MLERQKILSPESFIIEQFKSKLNELKNLKQFIHQIVLKNEQYQSRLKKEKLYPWGIIPAIFCIYLSTFQYTNIALIDVIVKAVFVTMTYFFINCSLEPHAVSKKMYSKLFDYHHSLEKNKINESLSTLFYDSSGKPSKTIIYYLSNLVENKKQALLFDSLIEKISFAHENSIHVEFLDIYDYLINIEELKRYSEQEKKIEEQKKQLLTTDKSKQKNYSNYIL